MISSSCCKQGLWNTSAEEVCKLMESLLVWNQSRLHLMMILVPWNMMCGAHTAGSNNCFGDGTKGSDRQDSLS